MPRDDIASLILRFRDLVTDSGGTISEHARLANEGGQVWWGWWSKAGERVPHEAFSSLRRKATAEGLPILLFDSGRIALYRARCTEIDWDSANHRRGTPDLERTPDYYGNREYLAWFQLSSIETEPVADPGEHLRGFTYVRVDDFFDSGVSRYDKFYDKRIASLEELLDQNRTIWFVRPAADDDHDHEIRLLDANALTPSNYPERFQQSASRRLLWVSDLHFGRHAFPLAREPAGNSLGLRIESALERETGHKEVGGLIVSGDITWRADTGEYEEAGRFMRAVQSWSRLDSYQIAMCPGNHDLRFSTDPAAKDERVTFAQAEAVAAYTEFYRHHFYLPPTVHLCMARRFLLGGEAPVELICLNSSLLQQTEGWFQGHGFVGEDQLTAAAKGIGWDCTDRVGSVRILVVHHHLLPVTYRENPVSGRQYSVVLDAEALARWIVRHRVRIVLHGHMHQPFFTQVTRGVDFVQGSENHTFYVFGMGSTGVMEDHLGETRENMFALLTLSRRTLEVDYYSVHPTNPARRIRSLAVDLWPEVRTE